MLITSSISLTGQTIPAGSSSYTFDVTVNGDQIAEGNENFYVNITNITGATVVDAQGVGSITNDDTTGFTVSPTSGLVTTESGGTAAFTVVLTSQPTDDVHVYIDSSDSTEGTATPIQLTYTSVDWSTPQTVTVTGVDDALGDGNQAYNIQIGILSTYDSTYRVLNPPDVGVTNVDNDSQRTSIINLGIHDALHNPTQYAAVGSQVHAYVLVEGNDPLIDPSGDVHFDYYQNLNCQGNVLDGGTITLSAGIADMSTTTPMTVNGLSFQAHYPGDAFYPPIDSTCRSISTSPFPTVLITSDFTIPGNNKSLKSGVSTIQVQFNQDVLHNNSSDPDSAINPANYLLIEAGNNKTINTQSCVDHIAPDDQAISINTVSYDANTFQAILNINNAAKLPAGIYRLFVCGTTTITDPTGDFPLNNHTADSILNFRILAANKKSVATGFQPGIVNRLPEQPSEKAYTKSELRIEIPKLGIDQEIVGVPQSDTGWDVSWLGNDVGYLQGTAFPTWAGNSVLTGHVTGADGQPGILADLGTLGWGDQIIVHAFGQKYIYEVRTVNLWSSPDSTRVIGKHEELPWLTLITCRGYDEKSDEYRWRTVVRAVQVSVE